MRFKMFFLLALTVVFGSLFGKVTAADTFDWTVTTNFGLSGSGVLTATAVPNTDYDLVTSFDGAFTQGAASYDVIGPFASGTNNRTGQDNFLYPTGDGGPFPGAVLDLGGLGVDESAQGGGIISACASCAGGYFFFFNSPFDGTFSIAPAAVATPEPGTLALLLLGLIPLGLLRRRSTISAKAQRSA
jgi:hypothetical protein